MNSARRFAPPRGQVAVVAAALLAGLSGCSSPSPTTPAKPAATAEDDAAFPRKDVALVKTDYAGLVKAIGEHKGKVVFLEVWGEF